MSRIFYIGLGLNSVIPEQFLHGQDRWFAVVMMAALAIYFDISALRQRTKDEAEKLKSHRGWCDLLATDEDARRRWIRDRNETDGANLMEDSGHSPRRFRGLGLRNSESSRRGAPSGGSESSRPPLREAADQVHDTPIAGIVKAQGSGKDPPPEEIEATFGRIRWLCKIAELSVNEAKHWSLMYSRRIAFDTTEGQGTSNIGPNQTELADLVKYNCNLYIERRREAVLIANELTDETCRSAASFFIINLCMKADDIDIAREWFNSITDDIVKDVIATDYPILRDGS
jgi:hypothetical protein